jgi:hypothetical protein
VFLIDDDEIEAGLADDLGRVAGRRFEKRADQRLAGM